MSKAKTLFIISLASLCVLILVLCIYITYYLNLLPIKPKTVYLNCSGQTLTITVSSAFPKEEDRQNNDFIFKIVLQEAVVYQWHPTSSKFTELTKLDGVNNYYIYKYDDKTDAKGTKTSTWFYLNRLSGTFSYGEKMANFELGNYNYYISNNYTEGICALILPWQRVF